MEVYSVEATLRLNDQLIAGLRRVSAELRTIDAQWERLQGRMKAPLAGLQAMRTELSGIAIESREIGTAMRSMRLPPSTVGNVERLETALGAAERRATGLATAMSGVAASGRSLAVLGGAGGRGSHEGPRGGFVYRGRGPGGVHAHTGISLLEMGAIAASFGMFEGVKMAAGEQLGRENALLAGGALGTDETADLRRRLREIAEQTSRGTIYSRPEVAKTMPGIAGMAAVPLDRALPFMPVAIRFGEIERQMGVATTGQPFSAQESAGAAIRMAHLMGISDPAQMEKILNLMAPATFTSHTSPANLVKVLQYMMGSAAGVGMSQSEAMNLGALGSILMPGTRAGTSINMMLQGMLPKGGPGGGTTMARKAAVRRSELVAMGLIDPKTGQLYHDASGGVLRPMLEHLHDFYEKVGPTKAYGEFVQAFSLRGARAAFEIARNPNLVSTNLAEVERREQNFRQIGGVTGAQRMLNQTAWNQSLVAWANLQTIMTDLAEHTLPGLTGALRGFNAAAGDIRSFLDQHPTTSGAIGYGLELGGTPLLARMAKRLLWGTGARAAGGAAVAGAAGGAAAGGGWLSRLFGLAGGALSGISGLGAAALFTPDSILPKGMSEKRKNAFFSIGHLVNRLVTGHDVSDEQLARNLADSNIEAALRHHPNAPFGAGQPDRRHPDDVPAWMRAGTDNKMAMPPIKIESAVTGQLIINMGELGQIIRQFVMRETDALAQGILHTGARPSRQVSEHSF